MKEAGLSTFSESTFLIVSEAVGDTIEGAWFGETVSSCWTSSAGGGL